MKSKLSRMLTAVTVLFAFSYLFSCCQSESYSYSYELLNHPNGSSNYKLNIAVSRSLYEYYLEKSHKLTSNNDFAKFVTPYALKPIAENLWKIYTDDEDFVNGVLMIVHQIPYVETIPTKYPVETIVDNKGDCDLFSFIAASIMKAGELDVVLLYYDQEAHMNVGVHLSHIPHDARGQAYSVTHNSVQYYVAECTGDNWEDGWRVGECPDDLKGVSAQVITLENNEQWAPSQVSASYKTLNSSTISLTASSTFAIQGSTITLSGQLSLNMQNEAVTIYMKINDSPWTLLGMETTDADGRFSCMLNAKDAGIYYVRASWSGNDSYAGADSPIQNIIILSYFFVLLLGITITLVCIGVVVLFASRQTRMAIPEPQPPPIPN